MSQTPPKRSPANPAAPSVPLAAVEQILGLPVAVARERYARLTRRERQVAVMIAAGKSNQAIAAELAITVKTMDIHRAHIKIKLDADTVAQIANIVNLVRLADATEGRERGSAG